MTRPCLYLLACRAASLAISNDTCALWRSPNSPNVGICLYCGTWLEGGEFSGATVLQMIDHFGKQNKIWKIRFRNVSAPLPHFVKMFQDNGYMEMYKIMKALRQVHFDGCVIGDHFPGTVGGKYVPIAYSIGYMRALVERANAEVI